ncbi:uncharacterized protein MELLADRAFT_114207 [Melampsora larici-populina 98AG31]|uniref:Uncharacterized protein n=1 Tax=Melampsora larici-populina (strain 98AG31 / pathotype 3-4-7) TaxID=747676 RepID=F4SCL7_MELLP|nr:uncharacterized protein MELLADRAFT_114207 [Melampsora larici-populina 98AG31]EGF97598.1 hypothetical protein MELLADRAFT_114207 [Melampsora larici-populina 98AG31]
MPPCDCSNCLPDKAEALWVAQKALTVGNFDDAMKACEKELMDLVDMRPSVPPGPGLPQRVDPLRATPDNPIRKSLSVEALVTRWIAAFKNLFYTHYSQDSDIGPCDYFPSELAWDLAKNIDQFRVPSDLSLVLGSEIIEGQYDALLQTFLDWKDDGASDSAVALSDAVQFRRAIRRVGPSKGPVSVEGLELAKRRETLAKQVVKDAKVASKAEQERQKTQMATAKKRRIAEQAQEWTRMAEERKRAREERLRGQVQGKALESEQRNWNQAPPRKRASTAANVLPNVKRGCTQQTHSSLGSPRDPFGFCSSYRGRSGGSWPLRLQ